MLKHLEFLTEARICKTSCKRCLLLRRNMVSNLNRHKNIKNTVSLVNRGKILTLETRKQHKRSSKLSNWPKTQRLNTQIIMFLWQIKSILSIHKPLQHLQLTSKPLSINKINQITIDYHSLTSSSVEVMLLAILAANHWIFLCLPYIWIQISCH